MSEENTNAETSATPSETKQPTLTANGKVKGRPPGANSFTTVNLGQLYNLLGANTVIPISRVWLKNNKVEVSEDGLTRQLAAARVPRAAKASADAEPSVQLIED